MRAFLGWLRGETDHCRMCAIPTLEEEDGKRPSRQHEHLVGERTRIINRLTSCLARLGIRGFNPASRKAPERIAKVRTPEGAPIPPNTSRQTCSRTRCSSATTAIEEPCRVMPASAGREWRKTTGKRLGAGGQRPGASQHDSTGLAVPSIPEGERTGAVVLQTNS
jgi:hypothetical protein